MHPFFDAKICTDEELMKKFNDLSSRLLYLRNSMVPAALQTVNQIELLLESVIEERYERAVKEYDSNFDKPDGVVIDTEESLKKRIAELYSKEDG